MLKKIYLSALIIIAFAILTVFINCKCEYYCANPLSKIKIDSMYDYDFNNNIVIDSVSQAMDYVQNNISYVKEKEGLDYWQLPEETCQLKKGDCEDLCLFFMYLVNTKLNMESYLILVGEDDKNIHTLVYVKDTNTYYELVSNFTDQNILPGWRIIWKCPYPEAIWMTYHYHNNVGKYY